ncbi:MAG: valine--tRNA ligase [Dehalococcoidia bacterium]|nr:valine--tRNA ligase [Dehalococcoidia bacterium]
MTNPSRPQTEMDKAYDPATVEQRLYQHWLDLNVFAPKEDPGKQPFVVIQPPPNVTGSLHVGHALTATVEDTMARWHRMQGEPTLWLPGLDHAGIATQVVVERELAKEGLTRQQLGRERFLERVHQWVGAYRNRITEQHHRLGASVDWRRLVYTLDPVPSLAVRTTFVNLFREGLIYRGERMINWCPRCSTALSDLEVVHQEEQGHMWRLRYPLADGSGHVTVATTRPETLLGDTAVAVNPADSRYTHLVGKQVRLPLAGRIIPIIADDAVDKEFGTGALKITPAHDPADFETGQRHGLPVINVMNLDGTINKEGGAYATLDRYDARKRVVEDLDRLGLLDGVTPHTHAVGHCDRCREAVEPLVSKQWWVKTAPLAAPALDSVRTGEIKIVPEHYTRVYENWMENIRDWCISRQLWWGHRIPVWYCVACDGPKIRLTLFRSDVVPSPSSVILSEARNPSPPLPPGEGIPPSPSEKGARGLGRGQGGDAPVRPEPSSTARPEPVEGRQSSSASSSTSSPRAENLETATLAAFLAQGRALADVDSRIHTAEIPLDVTPLVGAEQPTACPTCRGTTFFQDPDVLDTWFSSGLWPHSTLGWPEQTPDLQRFYPTSVMETGYDILFFWVARMIMLGLHNTGKVPFHTVYLHGLVRDTEGLKMSKTRGNVVDPLEMIDQFGADALRFALTVGTSAGTDSRLGASKLEAGRNFANKLWNAARFVTLNLDASLGNRSADDADSPDKSVTKSASSAKSADSSPQVQGWQAPTPSRLEDRWILSRLNRVTADVDRLLRDYQLGEAEQRAYEFVWDDFCDWYLEAAKVRLRQTAPSPSDQSLPPLRGKVRMGGDSPLPILAHVLEKTLRLLHPFMPFVTEEIWQHLKPRLAGADALPTSIVTAPYPSSDHGLIDEEAEAAFGVVMGIVRAARNTRAEFRVEPNKPLEVLVDPADLRGALEEAAPVIRALGRVDPLRLLGASDVRPDAKESVTAVVGKVTVFLPMAGLIDVAAERKRLEKELADCAANISRLEGRLADQQFLSKAPEEIVERERARLQSLGERRERVQELLETLPS